MTVQTSGKKIIDRLSWENSLRPPVKGTPPKPTPKTIWKIGKSYLIARSDQLGSPTHDNSYLASLIPSDLESGAQGKKCSWWKDQSVAMPGRAIQSRVFFTNLQKSVDMLVKHFVHWEKRHLLIFILGINRDQGWSFLFIILTIHILEMIVRNWLYIDGSWMFSNSGGKYSTLLVWLWCGRRSRQEERWERQLWCSWQSAGCSFLLSFLLFFSLLQSSQIGFAYILTY